MNKCNIQEQINKLQDNNLAVGLLNKAGIKIDEDTGKFTSEGLLQLADFLSMALKDDKHAKYIESKRPLLLSAIENESTTNKGIDNEQRNESTNSISNEIGEDQTDNETTTGTTEIEQETAQEVESETKVVFDSEEYVAPIIEITDSKVYTVEELNAMTDEELDSILNAEIGNIASYREVLKTKTKYSVYSGKDKSYIDKTVKASIAAIDNIIRSSINSIKNLIENLEYNDMEDSIKNKIIEKAKNAAKNLTYKPLAKAKERIQKAEDNLKIAKQTAKRISGVKKAKSLETLRARESQAKINKLYEEIDELKSDKSNIDSAIVSSKVREINKLKAIIKNEKEAIKILVEVASKDHSSRKYIKKDNNEPLQNQNVFHQATYDTFFTEEGNINYKKISTNVKIQFPDNLKAYAGIVIKDNELSDKSKMQAGYYTLTKEPKYVSKDGFIMKNPTASIDGKKLNNDQINDQINANVAKSMFDLLDSKGVSFQNRHGITKDKMKEYRDAIASGSLSENQITEITSLDFVKVVMRTLRHEFMYTQTSEIAQVSAASDEAFASKPFLSTLSNNRTTSTVKVDENGVVDVKFAGEALKSDIYKDGMISAPMIRLLYPNSSYINTTGVGNENNIPQEFQNAVKIHALAALEGMYKTQSVTPASQEEFDEIWGIDPGNYEIDRNDIYRLAREGNIPQALVIQKLGDAVYNDLGLKLNNNVEQDAISRLKTELGLYAMKELELKGITQDGGSINVGTISSPKTQSLIKLNIESGYEEVTEFDEMTGEYRSRGTVAKNAVNENGKVILYKENLIEASKLVSHLYGIETRPTPSLTKLEPKFNRVVRNGFQKISEDSNRIINDYESTAQRFTSGTKNLYNLWSSNKMMAYNLVGIGDLNEIGEGKNYNGNTHNIENAEAQASKYSNERLEFDTLMEFFETVAFDEEGNYIEDVSKAEFYLPWDFTVSGRYMNDSTVNPQNSKITRWVVQSAEMVSEIEVDKNGNFEESALYSLKIGMTQALDFGTDKTTDSTALEAMEKIFTIAKDGKVTFNRKAKTPGSENDTKENIEDEEEKVSSTDRHAFEIGFQYFKAVYNTGADENLIMSIANEIGFRDKSSKEPMRDYITELFSKKVLGSIVKKGEGVHALVALETLAKLDMFSRQESLEPGDKFTHTFTAEADDITSGMILTLMNIGTKEAIAMLEKGGVYTKEALEFWKDIAEKTNGLSVTYETKNAKGESETKTVSVPKIVTNKDGEFKLTHGWLSEFGKAMDDEKFRSKVDEAIGSEYRKNEDRIWFKDFYNTVARDAGKKIKSYSKALDDALNAKGDDDKPSTTVSKIHAVANYDVLKFIDGIDSNSHGLATGLFNSIRASIAKDDTKKESYNISNFDKDYLSYITMLINKTSGSEGSIASYVDSFKYINENYLIHIKNDFLRKAGRSRVSFKNGDKQINKANNEADYNAKIKEQNDLINEVFAKDYKAALRLFQKTYNENLKRYMFNSKISEFNILNKTEKLKDREKEIADRIISSGMDDKVLNKIKEFARVSSEVAEGIKDSFAKGELDKVDQNTYQAFQDYKKILMEKAIITLVGEAISRSSAKDPVMVFIYGSSINSIKKLIGNTIVKQSIYNEFIKDKKDGINTIERMNNASKADKINPGDKDQALRLVFGAMTEGNFDLSNEETNKEYAIKKINNEDSIVESLSEPEKVDAIKSGDLAGLVINADMLENIMEYSNSTYGDAFGEVFESRFGGINKFREVIKSAELVRYSIFKHKLNEKMLDVAKNKLAGLKESNSAEYERIMDSGEYGFKLSKNDIAEIKKELEKEGFGHSVGDSNGGRQQLDSLDKAIGGTQVRIVVGASNDTNGYKPYASAASQMKMEIENTGASGVITTHQMDGRKIGLASEGSGMLNIYDAFIASANKMADTSTAMNEEFINVTSSHNPLVQTIEEVEKMILKLGDSGIVKMLSEMRPEEKDIIAQGIKKMNTKYNVLSKNQEDEYNYDYETLEDTNTETSEEILDAISGNETEISVGHNYLTDSSEQAVGSAFNFVRTNSNPKTIFKVLTAIIKEIQNIDDGMNTSERNKARSKFKIADETVSPEFIYEPDVEVATASINKISKIISKEMFANNSKMIEILNKFKNNCLGS